MAGLGTTSLIEQMQAPLESDHPRSALDAVYAVVALANDGFRERYNRFLASR
jgi:hypothetical protein